MTTCKQLSEEVMQKIEKENEARARRRKIVRNVATASLMLGVLIPTGIYFGTSEKFDHFRPLSKPSREETQPLPDDDLSASPQSFANDGGMYVITLS